MAQKKKKNRKQGHPGRQQAEQVISTAMAAVERAVDQITPQFLRWYESTRGDDTLAMPYLMIMRNLFTVNASFDGPVSATDFDPIRFAEVFETVVDFENEARDPLDGQDAVAFVQDAVETYVDFLEQTGRWEGSADDLALLRVLVNQVIAGEDLDSEATEGLSSMEALAVGNLNEMKVVTLGRDLLRWLGTGKAIEPGGELGATESREAIALIESRMRSLTSASEDLMQRLYLALALAEAIEIEDNQVRPSAGAADFLSEDPAVAFGSLFSFVHAFLEETVGSPDSEDPTVVEVWDLVVQVLLMAAEGDPVPVGDAGPSGVRDTTWKAVLADLEELADLGLIEKGTHYDIPLAVGALLEGMFSEDEDDLDGELEWDADPNPFASPVAESGVSAGESNIIPFPTEAAHAAGTVLQLKLGLKYAKPPIWRRVLVSGAATLDDLHQVIQAAFDWDNSHLHAYQLTEAQSATLPLRDGDIDEQAVGIGQLLSSEKDKIGYVYDFGDNWELEIILEKVLQNESGTVPRCTGGRRTAPAEDSGGVPGWESMLLAANDPEHEMYEDYREWLDLEDGQDFDGSAFDRERINRILARL
ncbi:plasmid pRiA4b ORF-3 family protein [Glutamicibacter sp. MNS18]|uniref:plasmid pRiA4b ORF-3 family protein n=1 Tax=Glutamicibacter sp. MNS18 TaxID=2989817 RepID=UPI00223671AC|nr:plasmid pRiA4b ORF-3 family protein [Glutamicibacter sp. MNS18]MCW4466327.1 plasmid pRiA4b ORF-3 family protein [Glutamicibacter sp. MNS18]